MKISLCPIKWFDPIRNRGGWSLHLKLRPKAFVAQWIARLTSNQKVASSSLAMGVCFLNAELHLRA